MSKIHDLLVSRRFWVAIAGLVFVITDFFGLPLSLEQIESIFFIVLAWIVGDSIRATERRPRDRRMMRSLMMITSAAVFAAAGPVQAQEIELPATVKPFRLVQASVTGEELDGFAWIVRRLPDGARPDLVRIDGGRIAVWTGPPGMYDVDVIYQKKGSLAQAHAQVTILAPEPPEPGPEPEPEPEPGPEPDDETSVPEDEFGNLGRKVYRLAAENATADFPFDQLATLYDEVAGRLAGNKTPILPTINAASEALVRGQEQILSGKNADAWLKCRVEVGKTWDEYKQSMDRTKTARFYLAVSRGLAAHAD